MALTNAEKSTLTQYVLARACEEFRQQKPCVQRDPKTTMVGAMHAGCLEVQQMLALVAKA